MRSAIASARPRVLPRYRTALTIAAIGFNEGYRYVDWLLTVPLLLVELVAVLALTRKAQSRLLWMLVPASILMIVFGYPGEISSDMATRTIWGILSTIPFLFIRYVLFVELTKSLAVQPVQVRRTLSKLRWLLLLSWGVYPIAYLLLSFDIGADGWVYKQVGYSIADIIAKAVYAIIIYQVARTKSFIEDPSFARVEEGHAGEKAPAASRR
ncbi:hypothetical protein A8L33_00600 [Microbacterium aurantiacum]|nr:hypothetical protein A8L33_00600 [Microbacterium chocolatum]